MSLAIGFGKFTHVSPGASKTIFRSSSPPTKTRADTQNSFLHSTKSDLRSTCSMTGFKVGNYIIKQRIGVGASAEVRMAEHHQTGQLYAVKIFDLDDSKEDRVNIEAAIRCEIRVMQYLRHPNIVHIQSVLLSKSKLYLFMEYVDGGELYDEIVNNRRIDESTSRHYFQQVVDAVVYCHRRGVVHRDLKPENLLIDRNTGNIKITDFGLSRMRDVLDGKGNQLLKTQCGTPKYMAPEVIMPSPRGYDGEKCDAWACGVVLYALMAGFLPFAGTDEKDVFQSVIHEKLSFPRLFSLEVRDVLTKLLEKDPQKRTSLEHIRSHPWFLTDYQGDAVNLRCEMLREARPESLRAALRRHNLLEQRARTLASPVARSSRQLWMMNSPTSTDNVQKSSESPDEGELRMSRESLGQRGMGLRMIEMPNELRTNVPTRKQSKTALRKSERVLRATALDNSCLKENMTSSIMKVSRRRSKSASGVRSRSKSRSKFQNVQTQGQEQRRMRSRSRSVSRTRSKSRSCLGIQCPSHKLSQNLQGDSSFLDSVGASNNTIQIVPCAQNDSLTKHYTPDDYASCETANTNQVSRVDHLNNSMELQGEMCFQESKSLRVTVVNGSNVNGLPLQKSGKDNSNDDFKSFEDRDSPIRISEVSKAFAEDGLERPNCCSETENRRQKVKYLGSQTCEETGNSDDISQSSKGLPTPIPMVAEKGEAILSSHLSSETSERENVPSGVAINSVERMTHTLGNVQNRFSIIFGTRWGQPAASSGTNTVTRNIRNGCKDGGEASSSNQGVSRFIQRSGWRLLRKSTNDNRNDDENCANCSGSDNCVRGGEQTEEKGVYSPSEWSSLPSSAFRRLGLWLHKK